MKPHISNHVQTINPLDDVDETGPHQKEVKASGGTETAGAHSLNDTHICPLCSGKMELLTVGPMSEGLKAWNCLKDRICLPCKDED